MKKVVIVNTIMLLLVIANIAYGGIGIYNSSAVSISTYYPFTSTKQVISLQDDQYHYMHNNLPSNYPYTNESITDFLSLQYTGAQTELYNAFTITVNYELDAWDITSSALGPFYGSLTLNYDPVTHTTEIYRDENQFAGGDSIIVKITGITYSGSSPMPQDIELTSRITVNRFWNFNQFLIPTTSHTVSSPNNTLNLAWSYVQGAENYDLEWVFVSSYANQPLPDFTQATRINTTENIYSINLAYDVGMVYWRVRGVGPMQAGMSEARDGQWSATGSISVGDVDLQRNWTYSAAYAEQGKRKEVLSFFDGSTRQRQAITENNSSNIALVSETMYDYEGRSAVTTLAAPDAADDSRLAFYSDLNLNLAGSPVPYSRKDFDLELTNYCPSPPPSLGLNVSQGSGNYYSNQNMLLISQNGLNAAIPDAGNPFHYSDTGSYPFTETKYDLEGRVAEQAGPGYTLREGIGHTTKYYYATPAEANIYKLFGAVESGDPSHYQEKAVEDPNGQISISYLDMAGKVVATSIVGPGPQHMHNVVEPSSSYQAYTSLLTTPSTNTFNVSDNAMEINEDYFNTTNGPSQFSYTLNPAQFATCLPKTFNILYDLVIYITDPCGNLVILNPGPLPAGVSSTPTQITGTQLAIGTTFSFTPTFSDVGVYHITKKLTVDPEGLVMALKCFDDSLSGGCPFTSLSQYQTLYNDSTNTSNNCLSCDSLCIHYANQKYPIGPQNLINNYVDSCSLAMQCSQPEYIDPCAGLLGMMENDMSPGGQYFDNHKANAPPSQPADTGWLNLYVAQWAPNVANVNNAANLAFWASFNAYNLAHCSASHVNLDSWATVMQNWQPCFAGFLVQFDPEYCRYLECRTLSTPTPDTNPYNALTPPVNSDQFDQLLSENSTIAWATTYPPINPYITISSYPSGSPYCLNLFNADPFFQTSPGSAYASAMSAQIYSASYFSNPTLTLWGYANSIVQAAPLPNGPYALNSNQTWQEFVGLYEFLKHRLIEQYDSAIGCPGFCDSGALMISPPEPDGIATTTVPNNGCNTPIAADGFFIRDPDYQTQLGNYVESYIVSNPNSPPPVNNPGCCNVSATATYSGSSLLNNTCFPNGIFSNGGRDTAYIHVWVNGQDITCGGALISNLPVTIATLYYEISLAINNCNLGYSATYNPNAPSLTITAPCALGNITYNVVISGRMECLPGTLGIQSTTFGGGQNITCNPPNISTPSCLCIELAQIDTAYMSEVAAFYANTVPQVNPSLVTFEEYAVCNLDSSYNLGSNYLNGATIDMWLNTCRGDQFSSPGSPTPPAALNCNPKPPCYEDAYTIANNNASNSYTSELNLWNQNFTNEYLAAAFSHPDLYSEIMTMQNNTYETHYTLYYYDLAGNLTRTVPPAGVNVYTPTEVYDIETNVGVIPRIPSKVTYYRYNSLNELIGENTPDAGITSHNYDKVGRLRFTQNSKQRADSVYSYTKYDQQGRVIEVGESHEMTYGSGSLSYMLGANDETFPAPPYTEQVTQTYYDTTFPGITNALRNEFDGGDQMNLRSRVATTTFSYIGGSDTSASPYDYATHYSYDIHGNVYNIVQDNPHLSIFIQGGQEYKKTKYVYDLISGNVNTVDYQPGALDHFLHRYEYDADNRLTNAYTSVDSIIWDQDAKYFYYLHGPLARVELGQDKVQGMDYGYTINGWLKGVNSNVLNPNTDMGQDGVASSYLIPAPNVHKNIARDAYGFTLNYFVNNGAPYNDYASIGAMDNNFYTNSVANFNAEDLFNGNIKQMAVALTNTSNTPMQMMDYHYTYDQLNRIDSSLPYIAATLATDYSSATYTNSDPGQADYGTKYSYDPDGNIQTLIRNSVTSGGVNNLDNLTYNYSSPNKNWLDNVDDNPSLGQVAPAGDIQPGQAAGNYTYNQIGELTGDVEEKIDTIKWTVYGKVEYVIRHPGSTASDLYFYYDAMGNRICKVEKPRTATGGEMTQDHWIYTYYVRDAGGNIMAIYNRQFDPTTILGGGGGSGYLPSEQIRLVENPIYGSKRIGDIYRTDPYIAAISYTSLTYNTNGTVTLNGTYIGLVYNNTSVAPPQIGPDYNRTIGNKSYELTDHLGDVLMTVSDRKLPNGTVGNLVTYFNADIITNTDYYPFGQTMPGRNAVFGGNYRFGYNGKEQDPEMKGPDNSYDYGMRMYDPRVARFMSVDPLTAEYSSLTPYAFAENDVIRSLDLDGLEKYNIYERSFAPWKEFGGGYNGNNRGFTVRTDQSITSKINFEVTLDLGLARNNDKGCVSEPIVYSDPTVGKLYWIFPSTDPTTTNYKDYADSKGKVDQVYINNNLGYYGFNTQFWGSNPLTPLAPDINWGSEWLFSEEENWIDGNRKTDVLKVTSGTSGKGFPAYESFIEDEQGTRIFFSAYAPQNKYEIVALMFPVPIIKFDRQLNIAVDDKGNFMGVTVGDNQTGQTYSPDYWNKMQTQQKPAADCQTGDCGAGVTSPSTGNTDTQK